MIDEELLASLRLIQNRAKTLRNEFDERLDAIYKWYNEESGAIADSLVEALNGTDCVESPSKLNTKTSIMVEDYATKKWPRFWLYALLGCKSTRLWISDEDCNILKFLNDIRINTIQVNENTDSFDITFHFNPNSHFSNDKLTRSFTFKGDDVYSQTYEIEWYERRSNDDDEISFFDFFRNEIYVEDVRMAIALRDRVCRDPLRYVLRYQLGEGSGDSTPASSDEEDSSGIGRRYPFSWLF